MKLIRTHLVNIGPHRDTEVNWDDAGAIAGLQGENGTGKSFLLESLPAALWGEFPSRPGTLYGRMATPGDASIEVEFSWGGTIYRARRDLHVTDKTQRMESYLFHQELMRWDDGQAVGNRWIPVAGPKRESFDSEVRARFGTAATYLASVFAAQNKSGDLATAKPADRRAVFAEMLGLERLQQWSEVAKAKANVLEQSVIADRALIERDAPQVADLPAVRSRRDAIANRLAVAELSLTRLEAEAEELRERIGEAEQSKRRMLDLNGRIRDGLTRRDALETRIGRDRASLTACRALCDREAEYRAGASVLPALEEHDNTLSEAQRGAVEAERARGRVSTLQAELAALEGKIADLRAIVGREAEVAEQIERRKAYLVARAEMTNHESRRKVALDARQHLERDIAETDRRIEAQKARVARYREHIPGAKEICAACPLYKAGDVEQERLAELEAQRAELASRMGQPIPESRAADLAAVEQEIEALAGAAAEKARIDKAGADLIAALEDREDRREAIAEAGNIDAPTYDPAEHARIRKDVARAREASAALAACERARADADRLNGQILEAQAEVAEIAANVEAWRLEVTELSGKVALLDEWKGERASVCDQVEQHRREIKSDVASLGSFDATIRDLEQRAAEIEAANERVASTETRVIALRHLQEAFGRRGVQPLLFDAARPELERLASELLSVACDGRWAVRFETQRALKSTDGVAETLDIIVSDAAGPRDIGEFSGGEQKLLQAVIRLSVALWQAQKADRRFRTLCVDEAFDALDAENSRRMLAVFQSLTDQFDRIIIVSHNAELLGQLPGGVELHRNGAGTAARTWRV